MTNLFATVLTHSAPSGNYRGESEENRTVLQKITRGDSLHTVISPESMRNALREILAQRLGGDSWGKTINRRRLHEEGQLAVEFKDFPDAARFADDFLFGFMVADEKEMKKAKRPAKRDSVLRMNLAVSVEPYRFDATFHQSPLNAGDSPWKNAGSSALLHREVAWTAFQYPFALAGTDFGKAQEKEWGRHLLAAIADLSNVAGGHARAYYEMAPHSIVVRLTDRLVGGFDTYGFRPDGSWGELPRVKADDLPPSEFWLGGAVVRQMDAQCRSELAKAGAHLHENAQTLLAQVSEQMFGKA
ncbi:MAG: type I-B CRISPR-associated protein Cas7/Cst2/DevR [Planctomycetes bacterium]|nr:type I-B CRISPR-associated protein Cas7/Cst2/DevR [Planctomycetota bacterium]